ncbi:MAG TPA: glutamyl-tRNA reductase [Gaiellaceae bacterium]|nr:glutamyl-tRNA reductase [Gaiellaceae bacterium]
MTAAARRLLLVGTSYRFAPLELRERLHVAPDECAAVAARLAGDGEAVVLSTCNRIEVYVAGEDLDAALARVTAELSHRSGLRADELAAVLQVAEDEQASLHLFRVAAGLESPVPGEPQILGQVREAHACGSTGPLLDRLFRHAVHAGRRVRSETALGDRPASLGTAAAELARRRLDDLAGRRVLVVGAGRMGEAAVAGFAAAGAGEVVVANRTTARATALAARFGGRGIALADVPVALPFVDAVVSSTRSPGYVLTAAQVAERRRPLLLVDLAVPRDLDPAIGDLPQCRLHHVDDLAKAVTAPPAPELAHAEAIAASEDGRFQEWRRSLEVVPAIIALRRRAESIRLAELARATHELEELPERQRRLVETVTAQILNKLLHAPTVRAKAAAAGGDGSYAAVLEHLFALEEAA